MFKVSFQNYQDVDYIDSLFPTLSDKIVNIIYKNRAKVLVNITDNDPKNESIIYPNPASSAFKLKFDCTVYSNIQISILDLLGNEVFRSSEVSKPGAYVKTIDCRSFGPGYYIVKVSSGSRVQTQPLVIVR